jgi:hypothetical protein
VFNSLLEREQLPELLHLTLEPLDSPLVAREDQLLGSCTSWSLHDAVALERQGAPTAVVTTSAFEALAER